ncbi:ATP-binding protein [Runella sp.]|jgi:two-component system phosphate regulon sensor histidine kinase PhoR|uniref:sensor histidine kinase n=1 Tax=Runella sp. TaxID=1960881 RepID=UPI00262D18F2|nr:ATP-binding protein [Runella sp.]
MRLNPRITAFLLALLISTITVAFLSFVNGVNQSMLFVVGLASFSASFFMILYAIEILVYREVTKMHQTIQRLKLKDFSFPRKEIVSNSNPLKKLNQEIFVYVAKKQQEIDELKKLEVFRREFLADVSHELKTPIFAAQGFILTLLDGAMYDEKVRDKFLLKAAKSLDGLDALVKDLVALSQMETGEIRMHKEKVDLRLLTLEVCEQLENKANQRNTVLKIKPDQMPHAWVKADPQRISQVMTNLIENAIKYGNDNGKVIVHFEEDKKHFAISVRDNGPGIPSEHLPRIFERFYRVDKSRSREKGGTGLGLAIVKHILSAHGSKITVASKVDKGTTFTFKLDKME